MDDQITTAKTHSVKRTCSATQKGQEIYNRIKNKVEEENQKKGSFIIPCVILYCNVSQNVVHVSLHLRIHSTPSFLQYKTVEKRINKNYTKGIQTKTGITMTYIYAYRCSFIVCCIDKSWPDAASTWSNKSQCYISSLTLERKVSENPVISQQATQNSLLLRKPWVHYHVYNDYGTLSWAS